MGRRGPHPPADAHGCDDRDPPKEEDVASDVIVVGEIEPQRYGEERHGHQNYGDGNVDHTIWGEEEAEEGNKRGKGR